MFDSVGRSCIAETVDTTSPINVQCKYRPGTNVGCGGMVNTSDCGSDAEKLAGSSPVNQPKE